MINLNKKLFSITFASGVQGALQGIFMAYLGLHANYLGASALIIGLIFFSRNFFPKFLELDVFGFPIHFLCHSPCVSHIFQLSASFLTKSSVSLFPERFFVPDFHGQSLPCRADIPVKPGKPLVFSSD